MVLINKAALKLFGVSDVADLDSYNFFGNPSMPKDTLQRLSGGETVSFQAQYDFEKVRQLRLYKTSRKRDCRTGVSIHRVAAVGKGKRRRIFGGCPRHHRSQARRGTAAR